MKVSPPLCLGLFFTTMSTLLLETLLTRIFSFTMWYHFAFFAVSLALFGQTAGALTLQLFPRQFPRHRTDLDLGRSALAFSLVTAGAFLVHLTLPFVVDLSLVSLLSVLLTYLLLALPFYFSGLTLALAFSRRPEGVSLLYFADLLGAALGCLALGPLLQALDGPSAVFAVASLAALGAAAFGWEGEARRLRRPSLLLFLFFSLFAASNGVLARMGHPLLRILWAKSRFESRPDWERWNAFSRIAVRGGEGLHAPEAGWGVSSEAPKDLMITYWVLDIDGAAASVIGAFDGRLEGQRGLRWDVTNLPHVLRPRSRVCVVGAGGGRDVLSALVFEQPHVTAIEVNGRILEALNDVYGERSGHLDRRPDVRFVHDEARSWLARCEEPFDLIQVSFIDTWAATAAGAFVLSENGLYTVEAWDLFLSRLRPRGLLSFSRWYYPPAPAEVWRLASLAGAALRRRGIADPTRHVLIVANPPRAGNRAGVATLLLSPDPFSDADLEELDALCERMQFQLLLGPRMTSTRLHELVNDPLTTEKAARFPVDVSPPTDDRPFFFHMLRFRDVFDRSRWNAGALVVNLKAVAFLLILLAVVMTLAGLFLLAPLAWKAPPGAKTPAPMDLAYFATLGLAFMLVEIAMLQRLSLFLGHPSLGLSITLFATLLGCGLGSLSTHGLPRAKLRSRLLWHLGMLVVALPLLDHLSRALAISWAGASSPWRAGLAALLLLPLGMLMGGAFPLGLRRCEEEGADRTAIPWFLAANGATSVVASVLGAVSSLAWGVSFTLGSATAAYGLALLLAWRRRPGEGEPAST